MVIVYSIRTSQETSTILLNSLALELSEVSLHSDALQSYQTPSATEYDDKRQRVAFTFPDALPANTIARLKLAFKADISTRMMGYYKSTGGKDRGTVYALTQFQVCSGIPTDVLSLICAETLPHSLQLQGALSRAGMNPTSRRLSRSQ